MEMLHIPRATYRLQFNRYFTFKQALELVQYFRELGISDLYASPIFKSNPGSLHGYDVLDSNQIDPEIGTEEELQQLAGELRRNGMGLVIDIVPNHMCIADGNKWWSDVLENGPSSLYAQHFNIVWNPPKAELKNKVLLPVLDQQYGKVVDRQGFKIVCDGAAFLVEYGTRRFPLNPSTWPAILIPAIEKLKDELGASDSYLLELESIVTALDHLPNATETDPDKCIERHREKEIIKNRLKRLMEKGEKAPLIVEAVQESMRILSGNTEDLGSFNRLEELLRNQSYRLSFWSVTNDEINYKRFFDINELVSMQSENEAVFEDIHAFTLKIVAQGLVTGLRIDHVDGLFDPEQYFIRLQRRCAEVRHVTDKLADPFYMVAEKILVGEERLRSNWLVSGTTGYDFLNLVNGLFVLPEHREDILAIYEQFIRRNEEMDEVIYTCKKLILIVSMSSELHILARHLEEISEQHRWSRDYTLESLRTALREIIACFPVYRSYIRLNDVCVKEADLRCIVAAIDYAKRANPAGDLSIFDFIQSVLLLQDPPGLTEEQIAFRRLFVMRFQQLTGPVTAKGVEDTAFYRHYPLASLNEVGMDPSQFGTHRTDFHAKNQERKQNWPHTLLTTFTHDTKRSEDVRARMNVLSENPEAWQQALQCWSQLNKPFKVSLDNRKIPDHNEEYLLYQTLIGSWPLHEMDINSRPKYIDRINKYMLKALKEAKVHTSWTNPYEAYEKGIQEFIGKILNPGQDNPFLEDFTQFIKPIIKAGLFNSLAQIVLKMTCPGIPDFYQGSELWEFTLVDPDNRHPVDYSNRRQLLEMIKQKKELDHGAFVSHLIKTPEDGLIKLYVTSQLLNFRMRASKLFQEGDYHPIESAGKKARQAVAFSRSWGQEHLLIGVGRFFTRLTNPATTLPVGDVWEDTHLLVAPRLAGSYRDILSGQVVQIEADRPLFLFQAFAALPFFVLEKIL